MSLYLVTNNKKKLITKKVVKRTSLLSKATGLMFHKRILDEAHIFYFNKSFRISLTMFFVFFPIDVVFLKNDRVVEIKECFLPFTNYKSSSDANIFIELPRGFIKSKGISLNSQIIMK